VLFAFIKTVNFARASLYLPALYSLTASLKVGAAAKATVQSSASALDNSPEPKRLIDFMPETTSLLFKILPAG
jgi:hypothetical protein